MADDEKLPKGEEDQTGAEGAAEDGKSASADASKVPLDPANPFAEFINQDLSLSGVPEDADGTKPPADDKDLSAPKAGRFSRFADVEDDDDDEEDEKPSPPRFFPPSPFGPSRFGTLPPRFGSPSENKDEQPPPRPSPFGSSRFGSGSSPLGSTPPTGGSGGFFGRSPQPPSGNQPPSPFGSSRFGNSTPPPPSSFGAGGFGTPRPNNPAPKPFNERVADIVLEWLEKEARAIIIGLVIAVITLMTLLYIDNLRLTIATQQGQLIELKAQVDALQERLDLSGNEE